jgi:hypothetical protein
VTTHDKKQGSRFVEIIQECTQRRFCLTDKLPPARRLELERGGERRAYADPEINPAADIIARAMSQRRKVDLKVRRLGRETRSPAWLLERTGFELPSPLAVPLGRWRLVADLA